VDPHLNAVLAHYPPSCRPIGAVEALGSAGGYSGAAFWRFNSTAGRLGLRRWPQEHPTVERLQFIQAVLWHVHQEGFKKVPLPLEAQRHQGFIEHAGYLWELAPWMPGRADFHDHPNRVRLEAALTALAEFHNAASTFPIAETSPLASPGLRQRCEQLEELQRGGLARLRAAIRPDVWPELSERAVRLLDMFPRAAQRVEADLSRGVQQTVMLTPCLRDIWHDHVLFAGDEVTALIDFGALRPECVAADISRLLGSLISDDELSWKTGLAAYERTRLLSPVERQLIPVFDASTTLLSGINWLQWIYVEGRRFEPRGPILTRLDAILARLSRL
jgi:Ser/Thr protein kinase RdoA (MazF antagonist)